MLKGVSIQNKIKKGGGGGGGANKSGKIFVTFV